MEREEEVGGGGDETYDGSLLFRELLLKGNLRRPLRCFLLTYGVTAIIEIRTFNILDQQHNDDEKNISKYIPVGWWIARVMVSELPMLALPVPCPVLELVLQTYKNLHKIIQVIKIVLLLRLVKHYCYYMIGNLALLERQFRFPLMK